MLRQVHELHLEVLGKHAVKIQRLDPSGRQNDVSQSRSPPELPRQSFVQLRGRNQPLGQQQLPEKNALRSRSRLPTLTPGRLSNCTRSPFSSSPDPSASTHQSTSERSPECDHNRRTFPGISARESIYPSKLHAVRSCDLNHCGCLPFIKVEVRLSIRI